MEIVILGNQKLVQLLNVFGMEHQGVLHHKHVLPSAELLIHAQHLQPPTAHVQELLQLQQRAHQIIQVAQVLLIHTVQMHNAKLGDLHAKQMVSVVF